MAVPTLREWKKLLQADLERVGNKKDDLIQVIKMCEGYSKEIQSDMGWLSGNQAFIEQIRRQYKELFLIRFGEPLPEQTEQVTGKLLLELDTPAKRKKEVVEVLRQLAIQPGATVKAADVNTALEKNGFTLPEGSNPNAIISTILYRLKSEYEKVGGGVFRKKPAGNLFTA